MKIYIIVINFLILFNKCITSSDFDTNYGSIPELFHFDNYDRCMMRGDLFCHIEYYLEPVDEKDPPEIWNFINESCPQLNISTTSANNQQLTEAVESCYNEKYKHLELKGTMKILSCDTNTRKYPIDGLDIFCGILFLSYVLFVLYATFFEVIASHKSSEDYQKIINTPKGKVLASFSISRNWSRLKAINLTPRTRKLVAIQGMRFYNSTLVILAHVVLSFYASPLANTRKMELLAREPISIFFACGHLCMATFFFISSFLLAYELFKYLEDKDGFSLKLMMTLFVHRLMRLLPPLLVIILFHSTWIYHWGNGPTWNLLMENEYLKCRKNGWTNLLFINNIVNQDQMCLPISWSLALSMQYFVISLLYIWLLKKYEKHIWYILGAGVAFNIVGTFLQNYYYDFPALMKSDPEFYIGFISFIKSDIFLDQLGSFIGNMAGIFNGIAFGYFYYKRESEKPKEFFFNTKFRMFLFWMSSLVGIACVAVPGFIILSISNEHDRFWASIYVALSRPAMCIFIGTTFLGCSEGVGWLYKRVCEWPPTYILSRLSYCVYLVHMTVAFSTPALLRQPAYISYFSVEVVVDLIFNISEEDHDENSKGFISLSNRSDSAEIYILFVILHIGLNNHCILILIYGHRFFGHMVVIYILATILVLFVEMPTSALQKMYFVKNNKDSKKNE